MLTQREREIFNYIIEETASKGYTPTMREVCKAMGIMSTSTVHKYITLLREKGYLESSKYKGRALLPISDDIAHIPIRGTDETLPIPKDFEDCFVIISDSEYHGIRKGDYLIIRKQKAHKGDTVYDTHLSICRSDGVQNKVVGMFRFL